MNSARAILSLLALLAGRAATADELFSSPNFAGWEFIASPTTAITTVCHWQPDGSLAIAGRPVGYLVTTTSYKNYRLHAEWRWPNQPGNSGILVHISSGPLDRAWPRCIQVQLKNKNAGDLLPMAGAAFAEKLSTAPGTKPALVTHGAADSENPVGDWNSCDLTCRDGQIQVTINGVLQNKVTQLNPAEGRIGFQLEGVLFELRNVRLNRFD